MPSVGKRVSPDRNNENSPMAVGVGTAAIETHGLRRVFKTRKQVVEAVAGVDLTVHNAEIFGFLGPNGAGKTTTLPMLATLLPPSGGTATVAGRNLLTQPDRGCGSSSDTSARPAVPTTRWLGVSSSSFRAGSTAW